MFVLLYSLLMLWGCSDHTYIKVEPREPDILVYPDHINFGHLESGIDKEERTFTITNTGDDDLTIFAPVLVSGNNRYELQTDKEQYIIPGGELKEFVVTYEPMTYEANGAYIDIESNDEDEPHSRITIEGYGDGPMAEVSPMKFDYGYISIGCDNEERITIKNIGNMDLIIEEIVQMVTQPADIIMELGTLPPAPWVLGPGEEIDFLVSYIPTNVGTDDSEVIVKSNDPLSPEIITTQVGIGDVEKWFSQTWQQKELSILDVLWVIDNSGSMNPFQQNLSTNIGSFMSAFVATGADFHMAVITTDSSMFYSIISTSSIDPELELASQVVTGINGSGTEKGIEMAYRALSSGMAAPGSAFFRSEAKLVVIFVSDEPDHSHLWTTYLNFFDALKPSGKFLPYGVIGDVPDGCMYNGSGWQRTAQPGMGYWDLINHYGGSWFSICATDWGVQLQELANEVTNQRTFPLDEPDPIEHTILVRVNGQVTTEWVYDPNANAVVFNEGYIPESEQTITIDYAIWGCGE